MATCPFDDPKFYLDMDAPCPVCGVRGTDDPDDICNKCDAACAVTDQSDAAGADFIERRAEKMSHD